MFSGCDCWLCKEKLWSWWLVVWSFLSFVSFMKQTLKPVGHAPLLMTNPRVSEHSPTFALPLTSRATQYFSGSHHSWKWFESYRITHVGKKEVPKMFTVNGNEMKLVPFSLWSANLRFAAFSVLDKDDIIHVLVSLFPLYPYAVPADCVIRAEMPRKELLHTSGEQSPRHSAGPPPRSLQKGVSTLLVPISLNKKRLYVYYFVFI